MYAQILHGAPSSGAGANGSSQGFPLVTSVELRLFLALLILLFHSVIHTGLTFLAFYSLSGLHKTNADFVVTKNGQHIPHVVVPGIYT